MNVGYPRLLEVGQLLCGLTLADALKIGEERLRNHGLSSLIGWAHCVSKDGEYCGDDEIAEIRRVGDDINGYLGRTAGEPEGDLAVVEHIRGSLGAVDYLRARLQTTEVRRQLRVLDALCWARCSRCLPRDPGSSPKVEARRGSGRSVIADEVVKAIAAANSPACSGSLLNLGKYGGSARFLGCPPGFG